MPESTVRAHFQGQAAACATLGSPFTADLLDLVADRLEAGPAVADHVYVIELGATKLEASRAEFDARYRKTIGEWLI